MARIFSDTLQTFDCSGIYTLMAYVNSTWQPIDTIAGDTSGTVDVGASVNTIAVDTTLFIPGNSYSFKWVDSQGHESNTVSIYIAPALVMEDGSTLTNENGGLILLEN